MQKWAAKDVKFDFATPISIFTKNYVTIALKDYLPRLIK